MDHERLNATAVAPELYKTLLALDRYVRQHVDFTLRQLVKLRASLINGCARSASTCTPPTPSPPGRRPPGCSGSPAWRGTPRYRDAERAALPLTDAVTLIGGEGVLDEVWNAPPSARR
jgi:alkylhydroperoxidase family enzyme